MNSHTVQFTAKIWLYPGKAGWHFVSVPKEAVKAGDEITCAIKIHT
ncbi:MAG: hypothetical protein COU67_02710 [Candidatus Pacebacteria bacterium CG10_big_fil_rev_8_21_14_0_10_44_54]|nr:DUF1905 domain-containing protein [bacterium]PIR60302.1 MAG: hypothetical protein COU67_02710 [Candidatus Pacebacteria bacterium CG10_big_fil_rev_8_21_14_0_10_44_54]